MLVGTTSRLPSRIIRRPGAPAIGFTFRAIYRGDLRAPIAVAVKQIVRPVGAHPRGRPTPIVESDQPYGQSLQYEWAPDTDTLRAGSYVRPVALPGGTWAGSTAPIPAPDVGERHHVVVRAIGAGLETTVDDQMFRFPVPDVECGGVAIRAWGAPVEITGLRVSGT